MSVEVPVLEVFVLADRLHAAAAAGHEAATRLSPAGDLGSLNRVVDSFLTCVALAARGVAAETDALGRTVAAVAESWLVLDGALLTRRRQVLGR
jgi:hypothetical protein